MARFARESPTPHEPEGNAPAAHGRSDTAPHGARRTRRYDPDRRTRILDAALDVIAELGSGGATHRSIAERADVPLGSVTYHFSSLTDLHGQAFARFVELQSAEFERLFEGVQDSEQLVDVLVGLVQGGPARRRSALLGFELHLAALRDPGLRVLTQTWTGHSRSVLARFTSPDNAARLDALLEGMIMHALLSTATEPRAATRAAIARTLDVADGAG